MTTSNNFDDIATSSKQQITKQAYDKKLIKELRMYKDCGFPLTEEELKLIE